MLTSLYWSIICFEVCNIALSAILQDIRERSKAKPAITRALYGTTCRIPSSRIFLAFPSCESRRGGEAYREVKFCLIRFPVQLQSNMTSNFRHSSSRSAVSEVFPKHLGYNSSCTAWVSASAVSQSPAYQYSHFPMQSCQTGFILPAEFTYFNLQSQA